MFKQLAIFGLILGVSACTQVPYQGISSNAFPRHEFNFYFEEAMALDYSDLDADDWELESQDLNGRYAYSLITPRNEQKGKWTQALVIAYYPAIAYPASSTPPAALTTITEEQSYHCDYFSAPVIIEQSEHEILARRQLNGCGTNKDEVLETIRVILTGKGAHQVSYLQTNNSHPMSLDKFTSAIKQAKLVQRLPQPQDGE